MTYKPTQLMLDWEKALRDPALSQTTGALCKQDDDGNKSYCCLGVLEEVAGNKTKSPTPSFRDNVEVFPTALEYHGPTAFGDVGMPSAELVDQLLGEVTRARDFGGSPIFLGVNYEGEGVEAAELNDDYGWTFREIADQIRIVYIEGSGDYMDYEIKDLYRHENDGCE